MDNQELYHYLAGFGIMVAGSLAASAGITALAYLERRRNIRRSIECENKHIEKEAITKYKDYAVKFGMDNTPLIDLSELSANPRVKILAKDESKNPTGSVKARAALFNLARFFGNNPFPNDKTHFLDASSGNYAKALAYFASQLGYESILFVPERFSSTLESYIYCNGLHAKVLSDGIKNSDEARERAKQYADEYPRLIFLDQYNNDGSWQCHYHFTAEEILVQAKELKVSPTHFISGIGSGGTLIGVGKRLKESGKVEVIGLESRVSHSIVGIRSLQNDAVPEIYSRLSHIVDRVESVDPEEVVRFKDTLKHPFGVSAYANLYASMHLSKRLEEGVIVTIIPDGGLQ